MAEPIKVDLDGPLEGRHILIDPDELTLGLVEDLEGNRAAPMLDALSACIVGGDLPRRAGSDGQPETMRATLRRLKPADFKAVIKGVGQAFQISKS
jgi:formylmethanofuran dehydrogenase subunit B